MISIFAWALYVSPFADKPRAIDLIALKQSDAMVSYRRAAGWAERTRDQRY